MFLRYVGLHAQFLARTPRTPGICVGKVTGASFVGVLAPGPQVLRRRLGREGDPRVALYVTSLFAPHPRLRS